MLARLESDGEAEMPSNDGLLLYMAFVLAVQVVRLLVQEAVQRQAAVDGDVLAGDVARPCVAEQEDRDPGDVGRDASHPKRDPGPQAGVLLDLLPGGGVLGRPHPPG